MKDSPSTLLELGTLYFDRGDFEKALEHFRRAGDLFFQKNQFASYLEVINYQLRISAEMENDSMIQQLKDQIQDLVIHNSLELSAQTYYTLALCASYRGQHGIAFEYLQKALKEGLDRDDKKSICYSIYGLALVYQFQGQFEDALKELYNLRLFFQTLNLPDLELTSLILNSVILRKQNEPQAALELLWKAQGLIKTQKKFYLYINLLFAFGMTYLKLGDKNLAKTYLQLAESALDPSQHLRMYRLVTQKLITLKQSEEPDYDLVFDKIGHSLVEKRRGKIDFKNQFILLDLLRLFLKNPGEVFSKEDLVERVWKQDYDPSVHDNKIYVTIKRLRKMIEPDYEKPKYIFRGKNGYYLNKQTRVLFQ